MLEANVFGRAKDICRKLTQEQLTATDGAQQIVNLLYKRNPLSVLTEIYKDFATLTGLQRGAQESFKEFEMRFDAQFSKYNAHATVTKLNDSVSGMMLLTNSRIDETQRVSVLSAAAPSSNQSNTNTNDQMINNVSYEAIASVPRQCDCTNTSRYLQSHLAVTNSGDKFRRRHLRREHKFNHSQSRSNQNSKK